MNTLKSFVAVSFIGSLIYLIFFNKVMFNFSLAILVLALGVLLFFLEAASQLHDYYSRPKTTVEISKKQKVALISISILIVIGFVAFWPFLKRWI
jgi:hypothetical protein